MFFLGKCLIFANYFLGKCLILANYFLGKCQKMEIYLFVKNLFVNFTALKAMLYVF